VSHETSSDETAVRLRKATEMIVRWLREHGTDDATIWTQVMNAFRGAIAPGPLPVNVYEFQDEPELCVPLAAVYRIVFDDQGIDRQSQVTQESWLAIVQDELAKMLG
jgi:hypothetical protein